MGREGLALGSVAEVLANAANCMLISLVDDAVSTLGTGAGTLDSLANLQRFIGEATAVYEALTPGQAISPVTYSGRERKDRLKELFTRYASAAASGEGGPDGASVNALQRVLGIKDAEAERIGQQVRHSR